jgi:uncharacterized coiled-coil protein SlyX
MTDNTYDIGSSGAVAATKQWQDLYLAGRAYAGNGSAGSPAFTFSSDIDTGMFYSDTAAPALNFAVGSQTILQLSGQLGYLAGNFLPMTDSTYDIGASGATVTQQWKDLYLAGRAYAGNGSAGSPSFTFSEDDDTGIYSTGPGELDFSVAGSQRMILDGGSNTYLLNSTLRIGPVSAQKVLIEAHNTTLSGPCIKLGETANPTSRILYIRRGGGLYNDVNLNVAVIIATTITATTVNATTVNATTVNATTVSVGGLDITADSAFNHNNSASNGALIFEGHLLPSIHSSSSASTGTGWCIGQLSNRWKEVYAIDGNINTSDRKEKNVYEYRYFDLEFIKKVRPILFSWIQEDQYIHCGFVAQEIEELVTSLGLSLNEFRALRKERKKESLHKSESECTDQDYSYGLVYGEFIPILTKAIQELSEQCDEEKEKVSRAYGQILHLTQENGEIREENDQLKEHAQLLEQRIGKLEREMALLLDRFKALLPAA